ncbi:MAG: hypothetical protein J6W19_12540 [Prevotella sp.]|nr:hypothetical protein [Prevotella sp.]
MIVIYDLLIFDLRFIDLQFGCKGTTNRADRQTIAGKIQTKRINPTEKAVLSTRKSRSFYQRKPFFLWEKAVLSPRRESRLSNSV